jgi:hypothetical protein
MPISTENIIEIQVKAILIGEFLDFNSWIKNYDESRQKYGLTAQILHQDCNGFTTTGYDLKNLKNESPYPVKTYLLVQDPTVLKPLPFKSPSNN